MYAGYKVDLRKNIYIIYLNKTLYTIISDGHASRRGGGGFYFFSFYLLLKKKRFKIFGAFHGYFTVVFL